MIFVIVKSGQADPVIALPTTMNQPTTDSCMDTLEKALYGTGWISFYSVGLAWILGGHECGALNGAQKGEWY